jgi:hypothetical protein
MCGRRGTGPPICLRRANPGQLDDGGYLPHWNKMEEPTSGLTTSPLSIPIREPTGQGMPENLLAPPMASLGSRYLERRGSRNVGGSELAHTACGTPGPRVTTRNTRGRLVATPTAVPQPAADQRVVPGPSPPVVWLGTGGAMEGIEFSDGRVMVSSMGKSLGKSASQPVTVSAATDV